jgi:hypothetical protein
VPAGIVTSRDVGAAGTRSAREAPPPAAVGEALVSPAGAASALPDAFAADRSQPLAAAAASIRLKIAYRMCASIHPAILQSGRHRLSSQKNESFSLHRSAPAPRM